MSVFAHIWWLIGFATEPWLCVLVDASNLTTTTTRVFICNMFLYVCSSSMYCQAPSIPEAHDLSRSSSNASSFASVVEDNETEATEDYDTGMVRKAHLSSTHSSIDISRNYTVIACKLSLAQTCSQQRLPFKKNTKTDFIYFVSMSARTICCICPIQESLSSADTPHNRDSFTYSTWLEDNMSTTGTTSRGSSPGERNKLCKIVLLTHP